MFKSDEERMCFVETKVREKSLEKAEENEGRAESECEVEAELLCEC